MKAPEIPKILTEIPKILFEKVSALSEVHRILICTAAFLLLTGGFYYLIYSPKSTEIAKLSSEYSSIQSKLAQAKVQAKKLPKLEKELKEARVELRKTMQLLPDKREIPRLLEEIAKAGKLAGLEFLLFKPEKEVMTSFYAEIPVSIKVSGSYHEVAVFFDKVSKLNRIVNIFNVAITSGKKVGSDILAASCVAKTYMFVEGADAASKKGKAKKKAKKK